MPIPSARVRPPAQPLQSTDPGPALLGSREAWWDGRSPVGDRIRFSPQGDLGVWHRVVGVVEGARYDLSVAPRPRAYVPDRRLWEARRRYLVARVAPGRADELVGPLRAALREADPTLPPTRLATFESLASGSLAPVRIRSWLLGLFALLGLFLGALGVYGVVAYAVERRTREMGVRLVLGASRGGLLTGVLARGLRPVVVGAAVGLSAAVLASDLLRATVRGADASQPAVLAVTTGVLLLAAGAAALLPALRAVRIQPARTLRAE